MSAEENKPPIWNIANILTMGRIAAIPVFIVLLILVEPETRTHNWLDLKNTAPTTGNNFLYCFLAALVFTVASITDYLDGYLARKYELVTNLGKLLDPLADKLLVIGAILLFGVLPGCAYFAHRAEVKALEASVINESAAEIEARDVNPNSPSVGSTLRGSGSCRRSSFSLSGPK